MRKKKLSIIVPIYNQEAYLDRCLNSLINQDYEDYEIILINDGSTDNSLKICEKYLKKYSKIMTMYSKKNGGLSSARNYGMEKANSEYIWFVDADDFILKNCLNTIMNVIEDNDILIFNYYDFYIKKADFFEAFDNKIKSLNIKYLISIPSACNKIFRLELFKNNKIEFPLKLLYEDLATIPSLIVYTNKIKFDDNAYYYYFQRSDSIMHQKKYSKNFEDIFKSLEILENRFNNTKKEIYYEELEYIYIHHLLKNASLRFLDFEKNIQVERIVDIINEKYPNWYKNKYFKKYDLKRKILCYYIMKKKFKLIKSLRGRSKK